MGYILFVLFQMHIMDRKLDNLISMVETLVIQSAHLYQQHQQVEDI
jgi:hypothetical protein